MNREERIVRTGIVMIVVSALLAVVFMLSGCATWKSNTTTMYEATGTTLTEIYSASKALCDAKVIKTEDCAKLRSLYSKARDSYIVAGNALIFAINTEDTVIKQRHLDAYQKALNEVAAFVPQLVQLATKLGVKIGGTQ